jgi:hypothetical protein
MPEKPKQPKAAKSAAKAKPAAGKETSNKAPAAGKSNKTKMPAYFVAHDFDFGIFATRPKSSGPVAQFDTFDEAKEKAVNDLLEVIERCERKLWAIQRATSYEQLLETSADY